jgi:hypothetical protein
VNTELNKEFTKTLPAFLAARKIINHPFNDETKYLFVHIIYSVAAQKVLKRVELFIMFTTND